MCVLERLSARPAKNIFCSSRRSAGFQADGDLVWIVTAKKRYLATLNLRTLEERFSPDLFCRIHRNALVNVNQIRKMSMLTSQRWLITLSNGQELTVSKRQARHVRDLLHW